MFQFGTTRQVGTTCSGKVSTVVSVMQEFGDVETISAYIYIYIYIYI